jgi:cytochrome oxidase Cu insertion factor (SCO1/SenC/PrrC family)
MSGPALLPAAGDATEATGRRRRTVILIAVLWLTLLLMVAFAFLVVRTHLRPPTALPVVATSGDLRITGIPDTVSNSLASLMGLSPVPPKNAPGFALVDQHGSTLSLASLRGRSVVLEFMDPHCTDICPLVSQEFVNAYHDLGPAAAGVVFLAINVNRYHVGVADVAAFSQAHRLNDIPSWHFLTGTVPSLQASWTAYAIVVGDSGPTADVVHTDTVMFIDPAGRERFVAAPMADYTASGAAYLPSADLVAWGRGIALVARSLS